MVGMGLGWLLMAMGSGLAAADWVVSANENKIDLVTGAQRVFPDAAPDTVSLLDFSQFPPGIRHLTNIANTVLGPPSNVALSPDQRHLLIADSIVLDAGRTNGWRPQQRIHVIDLTVEPPRVTSTSDTGLQPSGVVFNADGKRVAVANRAEGSVSVFRFEAGQLTRIQSIRIADPEAEVSDVASSPDGRWLVASITRAGVLAVLKWKDETVVDTGRRISVYGRPYRVMFTPDGTQVLTSGAGAGNGLDTDALTVVELRGEQFETVDIVPLAAGPESFDISPDGRLAVAVLMNGSNTAPDGPLYRDHGLMVLLAREQGHWTRRQVMPTGRIPEGVVFTPDGRHLVVQCHPDRDLRVYPVQGGMLGGVSLRIPMPGWPSGMGAGRR